MEHFVHFIVNHHNILLFTLITFPGIPYLSVSIRLGHKLSDLNPRQLANPPSFAKQHAVSNYNPAPHLVCQS